jgi:16S rRNA C967 or C1407 C5-methylase (RsmB/RsmF family)
MLFVLASKTRYVKVNTLKKSVADVVEDLVKDGWTLVPTPETYEEFVECINELESKHFIKDFHLPDILVFPLGDEVHKHPLYKDGTISLRHKVNPNHQTFK